MKSARCIEYYEIIAVISRMGYRLYRGFFGLFGPHFKYRGINRLTYHLQLFNSRGTVNIAGDKQRSVPLRL